MFDYRSILRERARPAVIRESRRAPWLTVGVVCFGAFMGQLDASIVTVTFPAMERDFSDPCPGGRGCVRPARNQHRAPARQQHGDHAQYRRLVCLPGRRPGQHGQRIGTTLGISLMALALHLGTQSSQVGNHGYPAHPGYAGAEQARPAFLVLAATAATAAAIALAGWGQARSQEAAGLGIPGRQTRQVHVAEENEAHEQAGPEQIGREQIGPEQIGPEQIGPEQIGPEQIGPEQIGPEQIGPELADIVSRLRRAMRRAARATDPALGLSVAQLELLSCITEHPRIRPSQLARMLRLAPSSVATLLGGLQSAGYVTRTPGGDGVGDRRTVSLDLSETGTAAVTQWHRVNEDIIQAALAVLPRRDQAALRDAAPALRDLTTSIDAQAD
jgi:DNA-binding MarR family transcriptional regulator